MPWRVLIPSALAAAASGAVIIVTVALTLPEKTSAGTPTPTDLKETVAALSAAITAFLSAAFIDWASDDGDSRIADWIRDTFYDRYDGYFRPNSNGDLFVYSDFAKASGWAGPARLKRAKGIAQELESGGSNP
jgi:hypothetical protein